MLFTIWVVVLKLSIRHLRCLASFWREWVWQPIVAKPTHNGLRTAVGREEARREHLSSYNYAQQGYCVKYTVAKVCKVLQREGGTNLTFLKGCAKLRCSQDTLCPDHLLVEQEMPRIRYSHGVLKLRTGKKGQLM